MDTWMSHSMHLEGTKYRGWQSTISPYNPMRPTRHSSEIVKSLLTLAIILRPSHHNDLHAHVYLNRVSTGGCQVKPMFTHAIS
jgi:hypothetical protein